MTGADNPDRVTVQVVDGWAVHDGTRHRTGGEQVDVDPDTAERWVAAGWVEPTTRVQAKPTGTTPSRGHTK